MADESTARQRDETIDIYTKLMKQENRIDELKYTIEHEIEELKKEFDDKLKKQADEFNTYKKEQTDQFEHLPQRLAGVEEDIKVLSSEIEELKKMISELENYIPILLSDYSLLTKEMELAKLTSVKLNVLAKRFECKNGDLVLSNKKQAEKARLLPDV